MQKFLLSSEFREEDWEPLFIMDWKCYKDLPKIACFFPGGLDSAYRESNVRGFKEGVFGGPAERLCAYLRDKKSGEIMAYISCRVYRGPLGLVDGQFAPTPAPTKLPMIEDDKDREYWEWFWTEMRLSKRTVEELHVLVIEMQSLCTDPKWQRQGAAPMLLEWLFAFARKEGLRVALQPGAFAINIGFYEKYRFRVVHRQTFTDQERFPGREAIEVPTMIRDFEE